MEILVVENEKPAADRIIRLLGKIDPAAVISAVTESVEATINLLQQQHQPDLIIMDIQLDDGLCFEIFETINVDIPVIFTTAYDEYTLKAFKVNSVDYLMKPVEEESLREAISKFRLLFYKDRFMDIRLKKLLNELDTGFKNRFLVKVGVKYRSIPVKAICCFYILERSVFIRTFDDKEYAIDYSLDSLEKKIDPDIFFRINRDCIVNINAVTEIISYSSSRLKVNLNTRKPLESCIVSRDRTGDFKRWVDR